MTRLLAEALRSEGQTVTVATNQEDAQAGERMKDVVSRPGFRQLLSLYKQADAVILQGPGMRLGWPLLWKRNKALMVHHTISPPKGGLCWARTSLFRRATHAAVSHALKQKLNHPVRLVLLNPYDDKQFYRDPRVTPGRDVLLVGRLVAEKGAHVLVEALACLKRYGVSVRSTVVGAGPENDRLSEMVLKNGLQEDLDMKGPVLGANLADIYKQHRIVVIPSIGFEPFGLVALEAIASGCVVLASDTGGLREATGRCGVTVPPNDPNALADQLQSWLRSPEQLKRFQGGSEKHLAKHRTRAVAKTYLEVLKRLGASASTRGSLFCPAREKTRARDSLLRS